MSSVPTIKESMFRPGADIWGFFLISHGWTWSCWAVVVASGADVWTWPWTLWLYIGGLGPLMAGLVMAWRAYGTPGLHDLWRRLIDLKRIPASWYAVVFLLPPVLLASAVGLHAVFAGEPALDVQASLARFRQPLQFLLFAAFIFVLGPLPEEIGWRGYALDRLQQRFSALASSVLLGLAWGAWHLPLFWMTGYHERFGGTPDLPWFLYDITLHAILYTWIYNNTGRSLLAAVLFHFAINFSGGLLQGAEAAEGWSSLVKTVAVAIVISYWGPRRLAQAARDLPKGTDRQGGPVDFGELQGLPPPVARYFRLVLKDQQPRIRLARLAQRGELRTDVASERWLAFSAIQVVSPPSPGFAWNAKVNVGPLVHLRVHDAYAAGIGSGRVRLLSAITLAEDEDRPELNSGALHRYLAEAVWYPTALLPQAGVRWAPLDEHRAVATLTDRGLTVSLEFRFNAAGEVSSIYTAGRWGRFEGGYEQAPWEGRFRDYSERHGMRVPSEGDVGWYRSGEWRPVWKGKLTCAAYGLAAHSGK